MSGKGNAGMSDAKINELIPDPSNANKGTQRGLKALDKSLRQYGAGRSILLDRDNRIIAGNKTAERAMDIGLENVQIVDSDGTKLIAVRRTDLDLEDDGGKARALATYDNRVGQLDLDWDLDALGAIDADVLGDLWTGKELADLGVNLGEPPEDPGAQIDKADELRQKWGVETGQLWKLGEHRLICGDCTDKGVVARVMDIDPGIMVTDPPYGVEYDPEWRAEAGINKNDGKMGKVDNDNRADWSEAYNLFTGDVCYVWHDGRRASEVQPSIEISGFDIVCQIIWAKDRFALSRGDYHWKHEPCWYAVRKNKQHGWAGARDQSTLWEISRADDSGHGHGTQKPIECMERPIRNHTFDVVYDPFLGSGTTLIACERLGRKCRAVEISPGYVAVAIQRWVDMTGGTPELISNT